MVLFQFLVGLQVKILDEHAFMNNSRVNEGKKVCQDHIKQVLRRGLCLPLQETYEIGMNCENNKSRREYIMEKTVEAYFVCNLLRRLRHNHTTPASPSITY